MVMGISGEAVQMGLRPRIQKMVRPARKPMVYQHLESSLFMTCIRKASEERLISTAYIDYGHVSFIFSDERAGSFVLSPAIDDLAHGKRARRLSLGSQFL